MAVACVSVAAPAQAETAIFTAYPTITSGGGTCTASFVIKNETAQARQVFFQRSYAAPNGGGAAGDSNVYGFAGGQTRSLGQNAPAGSTIVLKAYRGDAPVAANLIRQQTFTCPS